MSRVLVLIICCMTMWACSSDKSSELMLFDFESDADLDQFSWKCHTLFSLSERHVTHGTKSLKIEFYPSGYPGWAPKININNWSKYTAVYFDIYNPGNDEFFMAVRIDDSKDYPEYEDRYNRRLAIKPGHSQIKIFLKSLITSGTDRELNQKNICRFLLFMVNPEKKHTLFIDNVRLM